MTHVTITTADRITTLRLDRPDKKNALTVEMYEQLTAGFHAAAADSGVRAVVLCGSGPVNLEPSSPAHLLTDDDRDQRAAGGFAGAGRRARSRQAAEDRSGPHVYHRQRSSRRKPSATPRATSPRAQRRSSAAGSTPCG